MQTTQHMTSWPRGVEKLTHNAIGYISPEEAHYRKCLQRLSNIDALKVRIEALIKAEVDAYNEECTFSNDKIPMVIRDEQISFAKEAVDECFNMAVNRLQDLTEKYEQENDL